MEVEETVTSTRGIMQLIPSHPSSGFPWNYNARAVRGALSPNLPPMKQRHILPMLKSQTDNHSGIAIWSQSLGPINAGSPLSGIGCRLRSSGWPHSRLPVPFMRDIREWRAWPSRDGRRGRTGEWSRLGQHERGKVTFLPSWHGQDGEVFDGSWSHFDCLDQLTHDLQHLHISVYLGETFII